MTHYTIAIIKEAQKKSKIKESLKVSFIEGTFAAAMLGITENYWVACGEALNVSALKVGLISAFPQFISSIGQSGAGQLTELLGGRLKTIKKLILIQWIALIPLLFLPITPHQARYPLLMICALFFTVGGTLPGPAWLSLMSDHLPPQSKGKYFGWRNRILGIVTLFFGLFAGQILQIFEKNAITGFAFVFGIACAARIVSWIFLIRMYDPPMKGNGADLNSECAEIPDSFFKFLKNGFENNFVRFSVFVACFTFSVNIVAPYLAVYMLRDLKFSYTTFSFVTYSATFITIVGVKIWGELADHFGNLKVIRATTAFISMIPVLWFISGNAGWLIAVQIAAGFAWSGFQLSVMTYAFSEVPSSMRTHAIGYLAAFNGLGIFLGSFAGGKLIPFLPHFSRSPIMSLFLISATLRFFTSSFLLKKITEKRIVQPVTSLGLYADALGIYSLFKAGQEILEIASRKRKQ